MEEQFFSSFIEPIADKDEITLQRLLKIQSNSADFGSWNSLAERLLELEYYDQAIICYEKALEINPDSVDSWYNKGLALSNLGRHDDAIQSYDRAIKIDPGNINALKSRGHAFSSLGKFKEALRSYERVIEIEEDNIFAWYNKGIAQSNLGIYDDAIQSYERVLEVDENNTDALNSKGLALERLGRYDEAIQSYDRVLEVDENNTDALNSKGLALQRIGKKSEAMQCFKKVTDIYEDKVKRDIENGGRLLESTKYREAVRAYERAIKIDPNNIIAWYSKGIALSSLGKYDDAIQSYERVLEVDENNTDALNSKGLALERLGRYDEAIQSYDRVLELNPNNAEVWLREARIKFYKRKYEEAIKCYNQAAALSPKDNLDLIKAILRELRQVYSNYTLEYDKALEIALKLNQIALNQNTPLKDKTIDIARSEIMLAEDLIKSGKYVEGIKHANKASSITPPQSVKLRSIIEYLILCSYVMQGKILEGDRKIKDFFEGYKGLDEDFRIEEDFWNFNGLIKAIDSGSINHQKKRVLLDLITILRGQLHKNTISGLVASLANTSESLQRTNRRLRRVIIPSIAIIGAIAVTVLILTVFPWTAEGCSSDKFPQQKYVDITHSPDIIAINPENDDLYVSSRNGQFSVIDCKEYTADLDNTGFLKVGYDASGVAVDSKNDRVYVANSEDDSVSVINTNNNDIENITGVGNEPNGIAIDPEENKVYVANRISNNLSIIDVKNNNGIERLPVGDRPTGVVVDPINNKVYVAHAGDIISVISPGDPTVQKTITVGSGELHMSYDTQDHTLYVANEGSKTVSVINGSSDEVEHTFPLEFSPTDIEINPETKMLYVASREVGGFVYLLDLSKFEDITHVGDRKFGDIIQVGDRPFAVAEDPDTGLLYVTNRGSDSVSIVNSITKKLVEQHIRVGDEPLGVAVDSENDRVYVANYEDNSVSVINTNNNRVVKTITNVGLGPRSLAIDTTNHMVYVTSEKSSHLSVINGSSDEFMRVSLGRLTPYGVDVNPATHKIYVANAGNPPGLSVILNTNNTEKGIIQKENITIEIDPQEVTFDRDKNLIYVTHREGNGVSIINGSTDERIDGIKVVTPIGIALASAKVNTTDMSMVFVASHETGTIYAYERRICDINCVVSGDGIYNEFIHDEMDTLPLPEGMGINDIVFSPSGMLYVLNTDGNTILIKNIKPDIDRIMLGNN